MCWSGTLGLPLSLTSADSTPHLWGVGGWGLQSGQVGWERCSWPWPLACSLLPGGPTPSQVWHPSVLGRKGLGFHPLLPTAPHPLLGWSQAAFQWLSRSHGSSASLAPGWVGGRGRSRCAPPLHPPCLSSRCAFLLIDSFISNVPSPFVSIPLPLPAQLSPDFCFSLLLSPHLLSAAPSLPLSLSIPQVLARRGWGRGRGRALFLPHWCLGHSIALVGAWEGPDARTLGPRPDGTAAGPPLPTPRVGVQPGQRPSAAVSAFLALPSPLSGCVRPRGVVGRQPRDRDRQLTHRGQGDGGASAPL